MRNGRRQEGKKAWRIGATLNFHSFLRRTLPPIASIYYSLHRHSFIPSFASHSEIQIIKFHSKREATSLSSVQKWRAKVERENLLASTIAIIVSFNTFLLLPNPQQILHLVPSFSKTKKKIKIKISLLF